MTSLNEQSRAYQTVADAIAYICEHMHEQPSLQAVAEHVHLSEHHLQRVFRDWVGISPKRFLQFLTKEHARQLLTESHDVLSTSLDTGLSSPGRLHDLMVSCEAMTPGEIKAQGDGLTVSYGTSNTPFGLGFIAWTPRGICYLVFCDTAEAVSVNAALDELRHQWPKAILQPDEAGAEDYIKRIFLPGEQGEHDCRDKKLTLLLKGTNFQLKVWEALLQVGSGQLVSYSQLAALAGSPKAQRAVGSALANNPIAYLIPCHRVIRENCDRGNYRWGIERKQAIHAWEAAQQ